MEDRRNYDVEMAEIKTDIKYIKKSIDENASNYIKFLEDNAKQHEDLMKAFEKAMNSKAGKWVEKVLIGTGSSAGIIFLTYAIKSIFNL